MRLFISINFDETTKEKLLAVQGRLKPLGGVLSRPENLHLTLAFLGEVPSERVAVARQAMERTPVCPMRLVFDHLGAFQQDSGALWWIGLEENRALTDVQLALSRNLSAQGFSLDHRPFTPHVTLARGIPRQSQPDCAALLGPPFSTCVSTMALMVSQHVGGKLTHTPV